MPRSFGSLALALSLLGCGAARGAQVPLPTDADVTAFRGACMLMYEIVDVTADPTSGTPTVQGRQTGLVWPKGFTAWRVGSEVEVLDARGNSVLRTGGRYWMCPAPMKYYPVWVVGDIVPCPAGQFAPNGTKCDLGGGPT